MPNYYLPNFETNLCENTDPGYYVECDDMTNTCVQVEADPNHIVLGQINTLNWLDTISEIIFDYETASQPPSSDITDNINIIFKNIQSSDSSSDSSYDSIVTLTKKLTYENDKYYRDISQNIIVFENTSENIPIKYLDSIYISSSINSDNLPNKIFMKTNIESYYLLTHSLQDDINTRYSTNTAWNKQILDVEQFEILGNRYGDDSLDSYLIFDINLNISNDQYECPENTFVYVDTDDTDGAEINRNICKVYDSGYYRDTEEIESFQDSSGGDTSSLSSDTTVESFTNFENFDTRIQTSCFNEFDDANKDTIDITESKLGGVPNPEDIDYEGCIYKCKDDGYYYNEGLPGVQDNKYDEPCPIGYKCYDKQNIVPCNGATEYQNQSGQTECKVIPSGGSAIKDSTQNTNIGFRIPLGKKYTMGDNTISNCEINEYKDSISEINDTELERDIVCEVCPTHTTTKNLTGNEELGQYLSGSTDLSQCIPDFGYDLNIVDREVNLLEGYDDKTGIIKCAVDYYLGDFDENALY